MDREWAKAVEQGNPADLNRILADDLISISGSGKVEDKAKEIEENELAQTNLMIISILIIFA